MLYIRIEKWKNKNERSRVENILIFRKVKNTNLNRIFHINVHFKSLRTKGDLQLAYILSHTLLFIHN